MSASKERAAQSLRAIAQLHSREEIKDRLKPRSKPALSPAIRTTKHLSLKSLDAYWSILLRESDADDSDKALLADAGTREGLSTFENSIEACIGTLKLPVGVAGPLRINGLHAHGDYYVPLATTEATLVASYARGARLISACGGCTAALLNDGLTRSPVFAFSTFAEAGLFIDWVISEFDALKAIAESTTRFGKLIDIHPHIEGSNVYLSCEYITGDAAGQNMTTIATEVLCQYILENSPSSPTYWFLEGNFSGDKKASAISFVTVRGKKVTAEVRIPNATLTRHLGTNIETMHAYWRMSALGAVMSGTIGAQGHYANGLTALYLATGQDAACAAESSVGITRMEIQDDQLYCAVTLPNVIVGTVGGGTKLPSQQAGLKILGLAGDGKVQALAEVVAAVCLAGEISLIGAISAGHFARAHKSLARGN